MMLVSASTRDGRAGPEPRTSVQSSPAAGDRRAVSPARGTAAQRTTIVVIGALVFAYVFVTGHPLSLLPGVPLGPLSLTVVIVWAVTLFGFHSVASAHGSKVAHLLAPVLLGMLLAKILLSSLAHDVGLDAWYYANSRFQGTHERSTDFPGLAATRRDRELGFGGDEFPIHFLNDVQRFNFFGEEADRRRNLPYSVRWQGALYVPRDGEYRFWLTASGPATLSIEGRLLASVDAAGRDTASVVLTMAAGTRDLQVSYARRPPRSGDLKVEWDLDGRRQVLAVPHLFPGAISHEAWQRDRWVAAAARGVDVAFLVLVALTTFGLMAITMIGVARAGPVERWRRLERPLLAAFLVAVLAHAMLPRLDRVEKSTLLGGGQDWLTHESFARDILVNGPLMTLGQPLGEGRTFYAQPFYPYALAAMHRLTGEALFGPTVLQLFGLGISGVLVYSIARRLFGAPAALATFVIFLGLRAWHLDWVARRLLSESVYFVVLPAALLCLVQYLDERRRRQLVLAGLFLGLAVVTRGPTLMYLPLAGIVVYCALRRTGLEAAVALTRVSLLFAIVLGIAALVPLRNWVVAGQPALVASSSGVNLQKLHRPTPKVRLGEAERRWWAPYVQDAPTRETLEFIVQDPIGYARSYVPLVLYTLGYAAAIEESSVAVWPELILMNLLYLAAIIALPCARKPGAGLLHAFVAVHFATMVIFAPYDYDNRLVLPMYLVMAPFAGLAAAGLVRLDLRDRPAGASAIRAGGSPEAV